MSKGTAFEIQWTPPPAVRVLDEESQELSEFGLDEEPENFDIAIRGEDESKHAAGNEPTRVEVVLQNVQQQSMLDFGSRNVLESSDAEPYVGEFVLRNNATELVAVRAERFSTRNGFEILDASGGEALYEIPPESTAICSIAWRPASAGGVRQSISFSLLNAQRRRIRVGAFVCGVAKTADNKKLRLGGKPRAARHASTGGGPKPLHRFKGTENSSRGVNKAPLGVSDKANRPHNSLARTNADRDANVSKPALTGSKSRTTSQSARPAASLRLRRQPNAQKSTTLTNVGHRDLKMRQVSYDERWMEKQEKGFAAWLNFVMDPEMSDVSEEAQTEAVPRLALAELARKQRHAALQRRAFVVMHSPEMEATSLQIDREIASGGISIRADRDMFKDLGLRRMVLDMLFCYQDAWLRIGLDTVLGGHTLQHHAARRSMKRFATTYFLGDPELDEEYRATKKGLFDENPEYKQEMRRRTLRRFLKLVIFLDRAKQASLIDHPSCLFRVDSPIKSSADMLINFAKEFLAGEGNVLRHLQNSCAYTLHHEQRKLDEFDFRVTNLAVDLRDGLRLSRAVELLTDNRDRTLSELMRAPAVSRLQKLHNTDVALKELERQGVSLVFSHNTAAGLARAQMPVKPETISNRDIVDGDRRKTLALLWKMILKWKLDGVLPEEALCDETSRVRTMHGKTASRIMAKSEELAKHHKMQVRAQRGEATAEENQETEHTEAAMDVLLRWCQSICAHHGMRVANFTTSMASGRALCLLIHHYHPGLLPRESIRETTVDVCRARHPESYAADLDWAVHNVQDMPRSEYRRSLENERANFQLVNECATALGSVPVLLPQFDSENVPEEKMMLLFVTYLSSRLLVSRDEIAAATRIQAVWRQHYRGRYLRELGERSLDAALVIQKYTRGLLARQFLRKDRMARKLQAFARGYPMRLAYCDLRDAAITLQAFFRCRATYEIYNAVLSMIVQVQAVVRRHQACIRTRTLRAKETAAVAIQAFVRGHNQRMNLLYEMSAAVTIQSLVRGFLDRRWQQRSKIAVVHMQAFVRGSVLVRRGFLTLKDHAIAMQALSRGVARYHMTRYTMLQEKTIVLQNAMRAYFARKRFAAAEDACIKVQAFLRMALAQTHYQEMTRAAITIQACVRQDRIRGMYRFVRESIIEIQAAWRGCQIRDITRVQSLARRHRACCQVALTRRRIVKVQSLARAWAARHALAKQTTAAVKLESVLRMHVIRTQFLYIRTATVRIQSWVRKCAAVHNLHQAQDAAIQLQAMARMWRASHMLLIQRNAALRVESQAQRAFDEKFAQAVQVQAGVRALLARKEFLTKRNAAIAVQSSVRAHQAQQHLLRARKVAIFCQSNARRLQTRRACASKLAQIVQAQAAARTLLERKRFLRERKSIVTVQSLFRARVAQQTLLKAKRAAVFAQAHARRMNAQREFSAKVACVTKTQAFTRAALGRMQYLRTRAAVVKLQSIARTQQATRLAEQHRCAVLTIQSLARGICARSAADARRAAVVEVQAFARTVLARVCFLRTRAAVIKLQSVSRTQQATRLAQQHRCAIVTIQSFARGICARTAAKSRRVAILEVQAFARTALERMQFLRIRTAVIKLQSIARTQQATRLAEQHRYAIVTIQSLARGICARAAANSRRAAILKLQALARRVRAEEELRNAKLAAVTVQTAFRASQARSKLAVSRHAGTVIQAVARMWICQRELAEQRQACNKIQTAWRRHAAQQHFSRIRTSTVKIQAFFRAFEMREIWLVVRRSTVTVQSCARMWAEQSRYKMQRQSALQVQAAWRGRAVRKHIALQHACATRLQAWTRAVQATNAFRATVDKATLIQAAFRGASARNDLRLQHAAATKISSCGRMAVARMEFQRSLRQIIMAQAAVRRLQARVVSCKRRQAVVRIQSLWRRSLVLQRLAVERRAVVCLQALSRGAAARRQVAATRRAVVVMQSLGRMILARRVAMERQRAVVKTQAICRDITLAQSWVRMRQARRRFVSQSDAACKIQCFAKKYCLAHLAQMRGFCKLQAIYRGWKVRAARSKELARIQRRLAAARAKATDDMTLGARTKSALTWLLESKNLGAIRNACETLQVSTRYPTMAEAFLDSTASDVLFALVHSCNRSLPHMKLLEIALQILLQVAKQDRPRNYERLFANKEASASSILDLMQMFRDQVRIFAKALALLDYFCSDSSRAINYIVDNHELQRRLQQIEHILRRKCDINKQHRPGRPGPAQSERVKKEQLEVRQHAKLRRLLDELDEY
ncbi:Abnormal spindle-like microcephaly-associated protein-like [Hondaea fermentalgiana]|uniref:Abnormal spindle-like microcephaly-associated protein-like n=1 Tax=Hondaea fermentalgiana TaxID=2315210 RepID=A0A2R5G7A7_9STRA|nr:Abnormal spindle-like microcephaly-associated protein-like [Hondaea fermentalgiana]|eukprot:GBG26415.1 Abnormal spindle-like microcephaly-associated protein-like [Hondaea fermentalgiana]